MPNKVEITLPKALAQAILSLDASVTQSTRLLSQVLPENCARHSKCSEGEVAFKQVPAMRSSDQCPPQNYPEKPARF